MKKVMRILLGVAVLSSAVVAVSPKLRDELHWRWTSYHDQAQSYAAYVEAWPDGRHANEAQELYDERSWSDATAASVVRAFKEYVNNLPQGKHVAEAIQQIENLHWQGAQETNTVESFATYLHNHPEGRYTPEALQKIDDLPWEAAQETNTVESFQAYLRDHPEGKYASEASQKIDALHWQEAQQTGTIKSFRHYLEAYKSGRFAKMAKSKVAALRKDNAPYLAAKEKGTRSAFEKFLEDYPGHQRSRYARAALNDMAGRNLFDLIREKRVEVETQGSGIQSVRVKIRRRVNHDVTVQIPPGTFFVSHSSSAQNMVTTNGRSVTLDDDRWMSVSISAACANRPRDIPGQDDSFTVQRAPNQKELQKLMPVLQSENVSSSVEQAAVWIVTDNADYYDLGILVERSPFQIYGGTRVINEYETARAMQILDKAGIDIKRKAIWRHRKKILEGLTNTSLKAWLQKKVRS
ncbi:MAG: hypothetical protein ACE5IR_13095 [bacterium]